MSCPGVSVYTKGAKKEIQQHNITTTRPLYFFPSCRRRHSSAAAAASSLLLLFFNFLSLFFFFLSTFPPFFAIIVHRDMGQHTGEKMETRGVKHSTLQAQHGLSFSITEFNFYERKQNREGGRPLNNIKATPAPLGQQTLLLLSPLYVIKSPHLQKKIFSYFT